MPGTSAPKPAVLPVWRRHVPTLALWQALTLVLVVGWLIGVSACSNRAGSGLEAGDRVADVTFQTIDGGKPRLSGFGGPVLVNFWATSCAVCLEEAPALVALRDRLTGRGYEMISVAMPYDRPDAVLELATANGWSHPVAIDLDGSALAAFEPVVGTPTNLLIAPDGTLAGRHVGRTDLAALERHVLELLAHD